MAVSDAFVDENLVFLPRPGTSSSARWVSIEACVWSGPSGLRTVACLRDFYPNRSELFQTVLLCEKVSLEVLVNEARQISHSYTLEHITGMLMGICYELKRDTSKSSTIDIPSLRCCRIFPTKPDIRQETYVNLKSAEDEWYISDRVHLATLFRSKLDLLAFDAKTTQKLQPLLVLLGLGNRVLSKVAKKIATPDGNLRLNQVHTKWLRNRMRYIKG